MMMTTLIIIMVYLKWLFTAEAVSTWVYAYVSDLVQKKVVRWFCDWCRLT